MKLEKDVEGDGVSISLDKSLVFNIKKCWVKFKIE